MKRIHIAKPGTFIAESGEQITLTKQDLVQLAAGFDPAKSRAPLVIGHPKLNAPAYGWTHSVEADAEGNVFAVPKQVNADFSEMVKAGSFKTVSSSLYPPKHPSNPTPGQWYLRHVGFLGAQPPAIKGLQEVEFAEGGDTAVTMPAVDLSEMQTASALWTVGRMFRALRDWMIAERGLDAADKVLSNWDVAGLEEASRAATADANAEMSTSFAEQRAAAAKTQTATQEPAVSKEAIDLAEGQKKLKAENDALDARAAAVAAGEKALADKAAAEHKAGLANFADGLIAEGRLLPAHKAVVVELATALDATTVVEFGEGDGKTSATKLEAFKGFLKNQPVVVPLGEAARAAAASSGTESVSFAAPPGSEVDTERLALHGKAIAHQKQHSCDYLTAYKAVGGQ